MILDAGCGNSVLSLSRTPPGSHIVGVDIDHQNISSSRSKANPSDYSYLIASITNLPFKQDIFNLIVCINVLEHIKEKKQAINNFKWSIHNNGKLIGSTSNKMNPIMLMDDWMPKIITKFLVNRFAGVHYERHQRITPRGLFYLLKNEGMKLERYHLMDLPPFKPWIYEYTDTRPPWFSRIWVIFSMLTKIKPLNLLKENMIFSASKN